MDMGLQGQKVIVTGGTRGIGQAIVAGLLAEGADVAFCARRPAAPDLFDSGGPGRWQAATVDITQPEQVTAWIRDLGQRWGQIDAIINNAGHAQSGRFEDLPDTVWLHDWTMKFLAPAHVVREASPWLVTGSRIVNISAVFGKQPHPEFVASSVTRASTLAWTKVLSKAWAPRGIRVNAINIGFVYSEQWTGRPPTFFDELVSKFQVPLGRFGAPEEVVPAALLLASPRSSYMTGAIVDVDGGLAQYL